MTSGYYRSRSRSSSSSSSSSDGSHKKHKKDKQHRDERGLGAGLGGLAALTGLSHAFSSSNRPSGSPFSGSSHHSSNMTQTNWFAPNNNNAPNQQQPHQPPPFPPPYQQNAAPPPSGYRIPLSTEGVFPGYEQTLQAPFTDADGHSPVFFASALFERSIHPCKVAPNLSPPCRVPFGGTEHEHRGRYDLLPFRPEAMELVPTYGGLIPPGRRPIEGGYEEDGAQLYHAIALINGVRIPGKTGAHLRGCNVAFGGQEHIITNHYEILCWR